MSTTLVPMVRLDMARLRSQARLIAVFIAIGLGIALVSPGTGADTSGQAFIAMLPVALLSRVFPFDDATRSFTMTGTLPVSRRTVVTAHYVTALLLVLATAALLGIQALLARGNTAALLGGAVGFLVVLLVNVAVTGPLSSRGGLGAMATIVPLLVFAVLMLGVVLMPAEWRAGLTGFGMGRPWAAAGGLAAVLILVLLGSYALSVRWYDRRDL